MRALKLEGLKFNFLTIIRRIRGTRTGASMWECLCDCGNTRVYGADHITRKKQPVKSCGCKKRNKGSEHRDWKGVGEISGDWWSTHVTRELRKGNNRHRVSCTVTIDQGWELFLTQNKKCALSGVPLFFGKKGKDNSASLDRIDNAKGYELGNVQWVHKHVNFMKRDLDQSYFIELCKKISVCGL